MPPILDPRARKQRLRGKQSLVGELRTASFDYDYPEGLDLKPGSPLHERIIDEIYLRANQAQTEMSKRHGYWRERDKVLRAFRHLPQSNRRPNERNSDGTEPRIILPVSHVVLETLLTYMMTAFYQDPIFVYEGVGPEDQLGGDLMTAVNQRHAHRMGLGLNLHTAFRDMFAYGLGAGHSVWETKKGRKISSQKVGIPDRLRNLFLAVGEEKLIGEYEILFEGNALENIDPYRLLPDPNVAAYQVDKMEFLGWWEFTNLRAVQREEAQGEVFNTKYLNLIDGRSGLLTSQTGRRGDASSPYISTNNPVHRIWMYIDLIPSEWKLGDSDVPEVWVFCISGDMVIQKAEPFDAIHGGIPVAIGAPDSDGYSTAPVSRLEIIDELQKLIDFLYSSHVANIKQVLYDNIVYDPSLIRSDDLNDPRPGKRIRYKKKAWGRTGVKDSIFQLKVEDITAANVNESLLLQQLVFDAVGTSDQSRGQPFPRTTRISAAESQALQGSNLSRLSYLADKISLQFMQPLGRLWAYHTQQFMTQEVYVKTTGELEQKLREVYGIPERALRGQRVRVSPLDLLVDYDLSVHDSVIPGQESPQLWTQLLQILTASPEVAQQFDLVRIVRHIARNLGAKSVDSFIRTGPIKVVRDEEALELEARGEVVPLGGDGLA